MTTTTPPRIATNYPAGELIRPLNALVIREPLPLHQRIEADVFWWKLSDDPMAVSYRALIKAEREARS